jgi:hypothetical protein
MLSSSSTARRTACGRRTEGYTGVTALSGMTPMNLIDIFCGPRASIPRRAVYILLG